MKWTADDYGNRQLIDWKPPRLVYRTHETETAALHSLKNTFASLPRYNQLEAEATAENRIVSVPAEIPNPYYAFLENTTEKCTSPEKKHSKSGMEGALHWVQRIGTAYDIFSRLTDGYGISLMYGERFHQFIRNSRNWYGVSGILLDLDEFREEKHPERPEPVYSLDELFDRYPLLKRICAFIMPSASSFWQGRPFKARGIILPPEPITDMRVYRAIGDTLVSEIDCIPSGVTKNPLSVGFGNTHNAHLAWYNNEIDIEWIQNAIIEAENKVLNEAAEREQKRKSAKARSEAYAKSRPKTTGTSGDTSDGENISTFIETHDAHGEMVSSGLLTPVSGHPNRYKWHESESDSSCEYILSERKYRIYSASMQAASPGTAGADTVNEHRLYVWIHAGLDMTVVRDRPKIREFLFGLGFGNDPKAFAERNGQPRYTVDTKHQHKTSTIETEQTANETVLDQWINSTENKKGKHLFVNGSAAGTGKTTVSVVQPDGLLYIAKTREEAHSVYEYLDGKEEDVVLHRARMFNMNHPDWETLPLGLGDNERPCISPQLCDLHAKRVGTPKAICLRCPLHSECQSEGYLSQAKRERKTSKVVYAWNECVASDEIFKARVKQVCRKDEILIVDEVNPLGLTQERYIDRDIIFDLAERFRHHHGDIVHIYQLLKSLLGIISTSETPKDFIESLQGFIDDIDDIKAIDEKLEQYPTGVIFEDSPEDAEHNRPFVAKICYQDKTVTVPIVDSETAMDTPAFFINAEQPIKTYDYHIRFVSYGLLVKVGLATLTEPPTRHWKLLRNIETFLKENADLTSAPFSFDSKNQSFTYHLKPTLNHRRAIFNTASDPDNLIGEAYSGSNVEITRHTGDTPVWKNALVFQLSGGNYFPRHSLIADDNGKLKLKPRAQEMIDQFISPSIDAGLKTIVVAPKAFQEIESINSLDCTLINHQHAEGRNDFQDHDIAFVFHYEPNHYEIQAAAKRLYRNPDIPLSFERETYPVKVNGVTFQKNTYTDERVQAVYNRECRQRLMQSAMRLRPNRNENKIIVFLTSEPVDIPQTPMPFRLQNGEHFTGDWHTFAETLQNPDVEAVMKRDGVSKRTAERRTQEARSNTKAERDARILELHGENKSTRESERIMKSEGIKVSLSTIKGVISQVDKKRQSVISSTYNEMTQNGHPTDTGDTGIPSENNSNGHHPVARSEYSQLNEQQALIELEYCNDTHNYSGASYLRSIFKQRGWKIDPSSIQQ